MRVRGRVRVRVRVRVVVDEAAVGECHGRAQVGRADDVRAVQCGRKDLGVVLPLVVAARLEVEAVERHRAWVDGLKQLRVPDAVRALLQPQVVRAEGAVQPGEQLEAAHERARLAASRHERARSEFGRVARQLHCFLSL